MKINGNSVKPGMILEHKGELWTVAKSQSVKPGKGGAFNQVEMKNIKTGSKLNERFRASEEVERVRVDEEKYQYLYKRCYIPQRFPRHQRFHLHLLLAEPLYLDHSPHS